ncbi:MAG: glycosyltransferase [Minisyncoccota bacterium]
MKALFVSNDPTIFDPASAARVRMHAYALAIGELHIVSPAALGAREGQEGSLFLHPVHVSKFFRLHLLAWRAHALILKYNIEIVSAQDPFEQGLAALYAVRGTDAKLHIQVHTDFLSPWFTRSGNFRMNMLNRSRQRIAGRVLPAAAGIRAVSARVKASLVVRYGSRIPEPSVVPVWVDATVPPPVRLPVHSFAFALIAVGRLEPEKRIGDILKALKIIVKQYPMVGLFIVGTGRERGRLDRLVRSLALEKHVLFVKGWLPAKEAWGLMRSAQAFIQASAYEGYGRTIIEAALAKVPIITTDVGIVGDILKNNEDVLSAPVADPAVLAHHISTIIEDNTARQELPVRAEIVVRAYLTAVGDLPARIAEDLTRTIQRV